MFARLLCSLTCCATLLLLGIACDRSRSSSTVTIGVIPKGTTHVFWKSVKAGADRAGKELGVAIKWDGPPDEKEINTQDRIIGDMINRGVNALVVAPVDKTALTTSMENAKKKMPVVVFDSGSDFKDYNAFVATDNYKGGQLAGEQMVKLIEGAKNVELALIRYQAGSASTLDREKGFLDVVKKARPDIKLYEDQFAGSTGDEASKLMSNMLQAHPGINAVYGSNESTTRGALGALEQAKKLGQVKFVGFDSSAELVDALDKGTIHALVLQDPVQMGYLSVKAAVAAIRGQTVAKEQPIAPVLVTQENKNKPEIQQLLRPTLE
ncbi:MAG: D-ribose-binding periplasmic protein [Phycisphaerales bacterium]|nr:D-ribose-binding periplasmic protein [Phycisphaerales bacterium]